MTGTLYLVGTPIGNLEDITLRALSTLRQVPLIAAEDTRVTVRLLRRHNINTPLTSYHEHNKLEKLDTLLNHLTEDDLALVSDAGMPGLSDPGYELVQAAIERGISIVPIPGPSAVVSALVVSGLPTDGFLYLGFLPRRQSARRQLLDKIAQERRTLIAFESPHRLVGTLEEIQQVLGERPLAVARELTKRYEEIARGKPAELVRHFSDHPPKGEITLVIGGQVEPERPLAWDDAQVEAAVTASIASGESPAAAAKKIAQLSGRSRRQVYRLAIKKGPAQS